MTKTSCFYFQRITVMLMMAVVVAVKGVMWSLCHYGVEASPLESMVMVHWFWHHTIIFHISDTCWRFHLHILRTINIFFYKKLWNTLWQNFEELAREKLLGNLRCSWSFASKSSTRAGEGCGGEDHNLSDLIPFQKKDPRYFYPNNGFGMFWLSRFINLLVLEWKAMKKVVG